MRRPEEESPRMAKNYDETDPDNRPLNREERRALREQDHLMEKRRQARKARERKSQESRRADQGRQQRIGPEASST